MHMTDQTRANDGVLDPTWLAGRLGPWSSGSGALYVQLAAGVAGLIDGGVLRNGDRLPAERTLAEALSVSRGTVVAAYDRLRDEGQVSRVQGSGTTVTSGGPTAASHHQRDVGDALYQGHPASIDLLMAVPKPLPRVIELVQQVSLADHADALADSEPAGLRALRTVIAERFTPDGLPTAPEEILVTAGAQQGIALAISLLAKPGDVVLTEEVTWPGLSDVVRRLGARTVGVEMDDDGVIPEALIGAIERFRPAFIGLNPHHHNPTGTRLSPRRRELVADAAADYQVPLVEDRVTASLAFDGVNPPPLAVHRSDAVHLTVDSVNKVAWPGLRIGWVRASAHMINELRSARALADCFSSAPSQLMTLEVLEHFDEIRADRVAQMRDRSTVLLDEVTKHLPDWRVNRPRGGLVAWAELPGGNAGRFCRFAAGFGVAVAGGREFSSSLIDDRHVRLPFTASKAELVEGVARLAEAWGQFSASSSPEPVAVPSLV